MTISYHGYAMEQGGLYIPDAGETLATVELSNGATMQINERGIQIIDYPANQLNAEGTMSKLGLTMHLQPYTEQLEQVQRLDNGWIAVNIVAKEA